MKNIFVIGKNLDKKCPLIFISISRDSKLTRILQDSLCGKTITSIIITLSPANEAVNKISIKKKELMKKKN